MTSTRKTDRRGFLKGLGVLTAAASTGFTPVVRQAVRTAIDDISTADEKPREFVPEIGCRIDLHASDGYLCSKCGTEFKPITHMVMRTTYAGKEGSDHVFLFDTERYCSGCSRTINKIYHPSPIFIMESKDEPIAL